MCQWGGPNLDLNVGVGARAYVRFGLSYLGMTTPPFPWTHTISPIHRPPPCFHTHIHKPIRTQDLANAIVDKMAFLSTKLVSVSDSDDGGLCVWACACVYVRACVRACLRACVPVCVHACVRACVHVSLCKWAGQGSQIIIEIASTAM